MHEAATLPLQILRNHAGLKPNWETVLEKLSVESRCSGFITFMIPRYSTMVLTFRDYIGRIAMRPPCGWGVGFEHSPPVLQITLSSVTLCLPSSEAYFMQWHSPSIVKCISYFQNHISLKPNGNVFKLSEAILYFYYWWRLKFKTDSVIWQSFIDPD
jgi:hypothetical protein